MPKLGQVPVVHDFAWPLKVLALGPCTQENSKMLYALDSDMRPSHDKALQFTFSSCALSCPRRFKFRIQLPGATAGAQLAVCGLGIENEERPASKFMEALNVDICTANSR